MQGFRRIGTLIIFEVPNFEAPRFAMNFKQYFVLENHTHPRKLPLTPNICFFSKKEHHFARCIIFKGPNRTFPGQKSIPWGTRSIARMHADPLTGMTCHVLGQFGDSGLGIPTAFPTLRVRILLRGLRPRPGIVAPQLFFVQGEAPGKQPWVAWTRDQLIW